MTYWAMDQEMLPLDDTRGLLTERELVGKMYKSEICGQISWIDDTVLMLRVAGTNQPYFYFPTSAPLETVGKFQ